MLCRGYLIVSREASVLRGFIKKSKQQQKTAILVSADSVLEIGNIGPPGLIECYISAMKRSHTSPIYNVGLFSYSIPC